MWVWGIPRRGNDKLSSPGEENLGRASWQNFLEYSGGLAGLGSAACWLCDLEQVTKTSVFYKTRVNRVVTMANISKPSLRAAWAGPISPHPHSRLDHYHPPFPAQRPGHREVQPMPKVTQGERVKLGQVRMSGGSTTPGRSPDRLALRCLPPALLRAASSSAQD